MAKKVSINIRIESELRDRFNAAAKLERRPASQVLRDLMHGYIGEVRPTCAAMLPAIPRSRFILVVYMGAALSAPPF